MLQRTDLSWLSSNERNDLRDGIRVTMKGRWLDTLKPDYQSRSVKLYCPLLCLFDFQAIDQ